MSVIAEYGKYANLDETSKTEVEIKVSCMQSERQYVSWTGTEVKLAINEIIVVDKRYKGM